MSRPTPWLLPLLILLAGAIVLGWWLPNRPRPAGPPVPDGKLNSVSFAPYHNGQSPLDGIFPSPAEVEADIALLAPHTSAIRTYAANEGNYDVAALAEKHGLKLWQGIWLGSDAVQNNREIERAIADANRYPNTIDRVIVGNEVLLRRDLPPAGLIAAIDRVRAAVRQPVTYADVWEFWEKHPDIAAHVDLVTIHLLPYWEDQPTGIDRAIDHVEATWRRIAALFPGKPIAIGETGWPSRGRWREDAAPGRVAQTLFIRGFVARATALGLDYNLIEAFDQEWKYRNEGVVGATWGLWNADRRANFSAAGPVVENPEWRKGAAASCIFGLVLLSIGLAHQQSFPPLPKERAAAQLRLAIAAMVTGTALGAALFATLPVLYDLPARIAGAGNLAGQTLLAVLLMRRLAGPPQPPRTGADASARIRALLRLSQAGWRGPLFEDLEFLFVWTAAVLQLLLLFDSRYRDFPLPTFAVPLAAVLLRAAWRDLPRDGGGREELMAGGVLALAALAGAVSEGPDNLQSLGWTLMALALATPPLLRCARFRSLRRG